MLCTYWAATDGSTISSSLLFQWILKQLQLANMWKLLPFPLFNNFINICGPTIPTIVDFVKGNWLQESQNFVTFDICACQPWQHKPLQMLWIGLQNLSAKYSQSRVKYPLLQDKYWNEKADWTWAIWVYQNVLFDPKCQWQNRLKWDTHSYGVKNKAQ